MSGAKLVKKGNIIIATILLLFIVACCTLVTWISNDNYTPKRVSSSISVAKNNGKSLSDFSIAENEKYIIYGKKEDADKNLLICIDKKTGKKEFLNIKNGDKHYNPINLYKKSIIYTKVAKHKREYDIYMSDMHGKKEKLLGKNMYPDMIIIDDWLYCTEHNKGLMRISLLSGKKQKINKSIGGSFVGYRAKRGSVCFMDTSNPMLVIDNMINNRRLAARLKCNAEVISLSGFKYKFKHTDVPSCGFGLIDVIGIHHDEIWFSGLLRNDNSTAICKAEYKSGKWKSKEVIKNPYVDFDFGTAVENGKLYYTSSDKVTIHMYDIKSGKDLEIYRKAAKYVSVEAVTGDNLVIKEWDVDANGEPIDNNNNKHYYINNSGKVLYELD